MAQWQPLGTLTLTAGSATATTTVSPSGHVAVGDWLLVGLGLPLAVVAAVGPAGVTLETPWPGPNIVVVNAPATAARDRWAVHRDFDPLTGAPLLTVGDLHSATVVNRAVLALSNALAQRAPAVHPILSGYVRVDVTPGAKVGPQPPPSRLEVYQSVVNADAYMAFHVAGDVAALFGLDGVTNQLVFGGWSYGGLKHEVWTAGNDGPGSGLSAHDTHLVRGSDLAGPLADDAAAAAVGVHVGEVYTTGTRLRVRLS